MNTFKLADWQIEEFAKWITPEMIAEFNRTYASDCEDTDMQDCDEERMNLAVVRVGINAEANSTHM